MLIPDPVSQILIFFHPGISDPTTAPKEEGENFFSPTIFCYHKYHKIENNFIFEQVKQFFSQKTYNYSTFYTKFVISNQNYGFRILDPGSAPLVGG
jgi:hypothetical protein